MNTNEQRDRPLSSVPSSDFCGLCIHVTGQAPTWESLQKTLSQDVFCCPSLALPSVKTFYNECWIRMEFLVKFQFSNHPFLGRLTNWMFPFNLTESLGMIPICPVSGYTLESSPDLHGGDLGDVPLASEPATPTPVPSLRSDRFASPRFSARAFRGAGSRSKNQVQGPSLLGCSTASRDSAAGIPW